MATNADDIFADLPATPQPQAPGATTAPDLFADLPGTQPAVPSTAQAPPPAQDMFADLPAVPDTRPPMSSFEQMWPELASPFGVPNWMHGDLAKGIIKSLVTAPIKYAGHAAEVIPETPGIPLYLQIAQKVAPKVGEVVKELEDKFLSTAPKEHWYEQVPEAAGSAIGFLASGGAARMAMLGVAGAGSAQYEDAIAKGADPDQAATALVAGSALGLTEALPGAYFLNRLNKLTGGRLASLSREGIRIGNTRPVWEAAKGYMIEGAQEGGQAVASNWIASDLAGYDPSRTLGENFWDNVLTGGAVGSILGGGLGLVRRAEEKEAIKERDAEYNLKSADPINQIAGELTPVAPLMQLYQYQNEIQQIIAAKGREATAEKEELLGGPPRTPAEGLEDARSQRLEMDDTAVGRDHGPKEAVGVIGMGAWSELQDEVVEDAVETALPKAADGSPLKIFDALQQSPVVVARSRIYDNLIGQMKEVIASRERMMADANKAGNATLAGAYQRMLTKHRDTLVNLQAKQVIAKNLLREIKNYAASLRQAVGLKTPIVIQDVTSMDPARAEAMKDYLGFISTVGNVPNVGRADLIYVKLDTLATEIFNMQQSAEDGKAPMETAKRFVFETLNHEFGHGVFTRTFDDLLEKARTGTPEEAQRAYETYNFIEQEYRAWLKNLVSSPLYQTVARTKKPAQEGHIWEKAAEYRINRLSDPRRDYIGSIDEFFADMTARLATQGALPSEAMTEFFRPVLGQYQAMFEQFPEFAKNEYGGNWLTWIQSMTLESKIKAAIEAAAAGGGKGLFDALAGKLPGFDPKNFAGLREHLDKWNKIIQYGFNLLQMEKENPHIAHWSSYRVAVEQWQNYQRNMALRALDAATYWESLAKAEASQLSNVFLEEQELKRRMTPKELSAKLTGEGIIAYNKVREVFDFILDEMHQFVIADARKVYEMGSEEHKLAVAAINEEFAAMKEKGYFPSIRFGKYNLTARATESLNWKGQEFKPGQLVTFAVFESQADRDEAMSQLRGELKGKANLSASIMREHEFAIQGMPRSMLLVLKRKLELAKELTPEMAKAIDAALVDSVPFKSFRKQFLRKKGVHGASQDMLRSFAYYARSAAGHIARSKYAPEMKAAIDGMQGDVEIIKRIGGYAQNRQEMVHWMERHFSYIMNPINELAALRGAGFIAYLGFNIKSAMVNLMQIPMVTYPHLAAKYGDAKATKELAKATGVVKDWVTNRKAYVEALEDEQGVVKKPDQKRARIGKLFAQGMHEGWLDQSLATELAIAASENNLDRGLHMPTSKRLWHEASRYAAMPFHLMEKMNRFVTASAAYNLHYEQTQDHAKSVMAAKQAVWTTQYENSRWNRPEFLRGKKSVAFLFMNYVQNTLHFAVKDKGARRWWMMMLLLGGVMGFPGAEDLEDIVDFTVTKLNRELGLKNPKFQLRVELREALEELHANPDLILHGLSQDTFGLGQVGEMTGIPIPHFDLSGSIGMGNIIPGTGIPKAMLQSDPNTAAVRGAAELAGATGNLVEQFYAGLFSKDPDGWKRMEKLLPLMAVRNISKAIRYTSRGEETTASGEVIAKFDPHDMRDALTIVGQALGFTPTKISLGWERSIAVKDAIQYYQVQQTALQRQINWAYFQEDREAIADAREAIKDYNAAVPFPELRMKPQSVRDGIKEYVEQRAISGMGETADRKNRRLQKSIEEAYPDPYGDSVSKDPFAEP